MTNNIGNIGLNITPQKYNQKALLSDALPEIEALYVALADLRERAKAKGRKAVCA